MRSNTIKHDELIQLMEQARDCMEKEDTDGCCRSLLPIIEYHCLHYEPLPEEISSLLEECVLLDWVKEEAALLI